MDYQPTIKYQKPRRRWPLWAVVFLVLIGLAVVIALVAWEVSYREQKMKEVVNFANQAGAGEAGENQLFQQLLNQIPSSTTTLPGNEGLFSGVVSSTIGNVSSTSTSSPYAAVAKDATRLKAEKMDRPYLGNLNAKLVIVEFADFQCAVCQQEFSVIRTIANKYEKDILLIFRNYPVKGDDSAILAQAGYCAQEQGKFWPFHDRLFLQQGQFNNEQEFAKLAKSAGLNTTKLGACLQSLKYQSKVTEDVADALDLGARGTPTFYVNGNKLEGAIPLDKWEELINRFKTIK